MGVSLSVGRGEKLPTKQGAGLTATPSFGCVQNGSNRHPHSSGVAMRRYVPQAVRLGRHRFANQRGDAKGPLQTPDDKPCDRPPLYHPNDSSMPQYWHPPGCIFLRPLRRHTLFQQIRRMPPR